MSNYEDFLKARGSSNTASNANDGFSRYKAAKSGELDMTKKVPVGGNIASYDSIKNYQKSKNEYNAVQSAISTRGDNKLDAVGVSLNKVNTPVLNSNLPSTSSDLDIAKSYVDKLANVSAQNAADSIVDKERDVKNNNFFSQNFPLKTLVQSINTSAKNLATNAALKSQIRKASKNLTDEEKQELEAYKKAKNSDEYSKAQKTISEYSENNPVKASYASYANNINPANSVANIIGFFENVTNKNAKEYDTNNLSMITNASADVRNTVANSIDNKIGRAAYTMGMSMADSLGTTAYGSDIGPAIMASTEAALTAGNIAERGGDKDQIAMGAFVSGSLAYLLGKISIENLLSTKISKEATKSLVKSIFKAANTQALSEGIEEALEEVGNMLFDVISMKDKSETMTTYNNYLEAGNTPNQAKLLTFRDDILQVGQSFAGGYISGGLMGLGGAAISAQNTLGEIKSEQEQTRLMKAAEEQARVAEEQARANAEKVSAERKANYLDLTNSDIDNIVKSESESQKFTDKTGIVLNGTNAENRTKIKQYSAYQQYLENESKINYEAENLDNADEMLKSLLYERNGLDPEIQNALDYRTDEQIAEERGIDDAEWLEYGLNDISNSNNNTIPQLSLYGVPGREYGLGTESQLGNGVRVNRLQNDTKSDIYYNGNEIPTVNGKSEAKDLAKFSEARKKSKARASVMAEDTGLNPRTNAEVPTSAIPTVNPADWDASLEMYPGRFTTNTETKLVNEVGTEETKKVLNEEIKNIDNFVEKISKKRRNEEARERYANNGAFERELFETSQTLEDGVSTDIAMIIGEEARIKGEQTGDYSDFRKWIGQMAQKTHKVGEALQALADYSRTSTGSMAQTEILAESFTEKYMKQHTKTEKGCAKLAGALKLIGNDGSIVSEDANLTHEQMLQRVRTTLNEESSSINEIFNDADVEYMARLVERGYSADELAKQIERRIATDHWAMSDEDVKTVVDLFNEADRVGIKSRKAQEFLDRAYAIEAQYIGGRTLMEKLNMFRYFAMLASVKTHLRNIIGNSNFGAVTNVKDTVASAIESEYAKTHPEYERRYSVINKKADASLLNACAEDFEQNGYADATDSSKFNDRTNIENARKLPKLMEWNSKALESEDVNAIKRKYTRSLAEYLKVNGKDASILNSNDDADIAFVEKAREHAIAEAKEATFHEDNAIASALSMFSRNMRESGTFAGTLGEMAVESMFPYKKTPANVLKSGFEYSPLGALKLFGEVKNKAGAAEYINTISKSLTGSAIFVLGIALARLGLLKGSNDDEVDDTLGDQEYSLNIGYFSYTVDWLAPAALPLFAGVEMYKAFEGDNNFWDAFSSIAEPVIELSMLQGFKNTLKSIGYDMLYDPNNFVADLALNIATGYAGQFVPTTLGQVARAIDNTRRSTYSDKDGVVGTLDYQLEKIQNKLPWLSFTNEAYIDNFGNKQQNGDILSAAFGIDSNNPWMLPLRLMYQMASPGYASNSKRNDITAELERVSDATGSNLIPKLADKKYNGEKVDEKTYEQMQNFLGQTTMSAFKILTSDSSYKKLSDENKKQAIRDVENFANVLMKEKYVGYKPEEVSTYKKAYNIYKSDGLKAVVKYYIERNSK